MKLKNLTLCAFAAASCSAGAANMILNGDFEDGFAGAENYNASSELGTHNYATWDAIPTDWSGTDRTWGVTGQGATAFPVANGLYAMRLDANSVDGEDKLTQTVNLTAGTEYNFGIDMWSEANSASDLTVQLVGATDTIAVFTNYVDAVVGIERLSKTFTAPTTGSYTLELFNANQTSDSNNKHTWVDNVSLTAVPEPSSATLLGLGGLALILRRRK
jgi:hypothetical protein